MYRQIVCMMDVHNLISKYEWTALTVPALPIGYIQVTPLDEECPVSSNMFRLLRHFNKMFACILDRFKPTLAAKLHFTFCSVKLSFSANQIISFGHQIKSRCETGLRNCV